MAPPARVVRTAQLSIRSGSAASAAAPSGTSRTPRVPERSDGERPMLASPHVMRNAPSVGEGLPLEEPIHDDETSMPAERVPERGRARCGLRPSLDAPAPDLLRFVGLRPPWDESPANERELAGDRGGASALGKWLRGAIRGPGGGGAPGADREDRLRRRDVEARGTEVDRIDLEEARHVLGRTRECRSSAHARNLARGVLACGRSGPHESDSSGSTPGSRTPQDGYSMPGTERRGGQQTRKIVASRLVRTCLTWRHGECCMSARHVGARGSEPR